MKLQRLGKSISEVEVLNISIHGIWLYLEGKEYYLSYSEYPWFKNAKISEICNIEVLYGTHLHWPDLDVDLEIESIEYPEKYPLIYK